MNKNTTHEEFGQAAVKCKQAYESLRKNEKVFKTMFYRHNAVMLIIEPESGQIIDANHSAEDFYGYTIDKLRTMKIQDINTLSQEKIKIERKRAITEKRNYFIFPHRKENGEIRTVEVHSSPIIFEEVKLLFSIIHDITDQKLAEEARRESEKKYKELVEHSNSIILRWKADGTITFFNEFAQKFFGYSENEIIGQKILGTIVPETETTGRSLREIMADIINIPEKYVNNENENICKDGTRVWVGWTNRAVFNDDGSLREILSVGNDITEQKQAQHKLLKSEERFRQMAENINQGLTIIENDKIVYVNKTAAEITGYTIDELKKMRTHDITVPEDKGLIRQAYEKYISEGILPKELEFRIIRKDGTLRSVYNTYSLQKTSLGTIYRYIVTTDITERKQAEETLRKSEERLRQHQILIHMTSQMAKVGGWKFDVKTQRVLWTDETYHIHEKEQSQEHEDLKEAISFYHPDDQPKLKKAFEEAVKQGKPYNLELRLITAKGNKKWVHTLCQPEVIDGKVVTLHGSFQDITEGKQMQEQLQQTQKMEAIGTLAGGIAHDFNNILGGIIGYAEIAKDDIADGLPVDSYFDDILNLSNRARDLTQQILTFSRKNVQESGPMMLQPVLKECLKMLRATLPKTIDLKQNINSNCRAIVANPVQMHQLIMNLCTNAADEMKDTGGDIEVTLDEIEIPEKKASYGCTINPGQYVSLRVRDTGNGIPEENIKRIFEPFFTTKEKGKGTGMGLSVVYGIVRSHDGAIAVDSAPEQGTVFSVLLPCADVALELAQEAPDPKLLPRGTERILFVDDEESIIEIAQRMLSHAGYEVTAVRNASQALALLKDDPGAYDIVITDQTMPKMTGFQLSQELLKIRPDIPIILCTGFSEIVSEETAKVAGVKEFLTKPFTREKIGETIRKVLDQNKS